MEGKRFPRLALFYLLTIINRKNRIAEFHTADTPIRQILFRLARPFSFGTEREKPALKRWLYLRQGARQESRGHDNAVLMAARGTDIAGISKSAAQSRSLPEPLVNTIPRNFARSTYLADRVVV